MKHTKAPWHISRFLGFVLALFFVGGTPALAEKTAYESVAVDDWQGVKGILLMVKGTYLTVQPSEDEQLNCDYEKGLIKVNTHFEEDTLVIAVSSIAETTAYYDTAGFATLNLPQEGYDLLSVDALTAHVMVMPINVAMNLKGQKSALDVCVAQDYDKHLDLECIDGEGYFMLSMDAVDYTLIANVHGGSLSVPTALPKYDGKGSYTYTDGTGAAAMNLTLVDSRFNVGFRKN